MHLRSILSKRNFMALVVLALLGLVGFWVITIPKPLSEADLPQHVPDVANGERMYNVGGCHSCHVPGPELTGVDAALPAGGTALKTPVGVLYPPNLTPDPETGLGLWTDVQFINAMQKGISHRGEHLIPAFPYTSYAHMRVEDVLDIKAYLATLAPVKNAAKAHEVFALPIVRRGLGLWKIVGFDETKWLADPAQTAGWNRGSYLVNGPGHCNECHTPRNLFMASDTSKFLAGGPHPEGKGKVPSLRGLVERARYKDVKDLVSAFQFGEAMGYDKMSSGGMGRVQANLAKLPETDVLAIAEYLTSLK